MIKWYIHLIFILIYFLVVVQLLSHVQLFATPWTAVHQAPLSVEFSRQEYWSGLPFPSPGETLYLFFNQLWPVIPLESSVVNQFNSD